MSKVSIIIPLFNQADTIRWTIQSAIRQTHPDTEIIVVDDGSTDIEASHAPTCFPQVVLLRTVNRGVAKARNIGARRASGDYLLFLDGDDWIEPTYIEKTLASMRPETGIVATDMHVFTNDKDSIVSARVVSADELKKDNCIPITSLINRKAFDETGGYKDNVYEDWELWINILSRGWRMRVVNEPLFHYRSRSTGNRITFLTTHHEALMNNMKKLYPTGVWQQ